MVKRRKGKSPRSGLRNSLGIPKAKYQQLLKEAKNTRARIRSFEKRADSDAYNVPDSAQYTMNELIFRLNSGESYKNIMSEMKGITSKSILTAGIDTSSSEFGYTMTVSDRNALKAAINSANRAIAGASKAKELQGVIPEKFSYSNIAETIYTEKQLENIIFDLSGYTKEGMDITTLSSGEAITVAEKRRLFNILERENQRRMSQPEYQAAYGQGEMPTYLVTRNRHDVKPMEYTQFDLAKLRKRAVTWDDPARVYRANLFLDNYKNSLEKFRDLMIMHSYSTEKFEEQVERIVDIIARLYNNEEAITEISKYMPNIRITIISDKVVYDGDYGGIESETFSFQEIYHEWLKAEDTYLLNGEVL